MRGKGIVCGDIVELKSGGPPMTVQKTGLLAKTKQRGAWCAWFDGNEVEHHAFAIESLRKIKPAPVVRKPRHPGIPKGTTPLQ